jgi:hypothetical protein
MVLYKFSELSDQAKRVAVEEYIHDAKLFGFWNEDQTEEDVYELLASPHETHRYDENGVLQGKVRYLDHNQAEFIETGEY